MKFIKVFIISIILSLLSLYSCSNLRSKTLEKISIKNNIDSNSILNRVRILIKEISNRHLKSPNLSAKMKIAGALPEGYPLRMIENAKKMRNNKEVWSPLMSLPTEVWRYCLFPQFKINYKKWCINQYSSDVKEALNCKFQINLACYFTFCNVCCDHLQLELINTAQNDIIGELLDLKNQEGAKKIKDLVNYNEIKRCKSSCQQYYHVQMPIELPPPSRDPNLGKKKSFAAISCSDLLRWGE